MQIKILFLVGLSQTREDMIRFPVIGDWGGSSFI